MKQIGVILPGGKIKLHRTNQERELGKVTQEVMGILTGAPPNFGPRLESQSAPEPHPTSKPKPEQDD